MLGRIQAILGKFDWALLAAMVLLFAIGFAAIWSVALSRTPPDLTTVKKQAIAFILGIILIFILASINYRILRGYGFLIGIVALALLVIVLVFGKTIRGTTGWFGIAGINFQPVEFVKFAVVVFLAKYLADHPRDSFRMREFLISSAAVGAVVILILLQPDLGSAAIIIATWLGLLAFARIRPRYIISLICSGLLVVLVSWAFILAPYQKERIMTFVDPGRDPLGRGYNVRQSIIAVGSGQLFGRGLGFGSQSQLRFLPESHTDFIFAVIAEELGFFGVLLVMAFFGMLFLRLLRAVEFARDDFTAFLALGILIVFFVQFIVNVGMNLGVVPVTGIALPFLSYGGSALLMSMFMMGVAESIAARRPLARR